MNHKKTAKFKVNGIHCNGCARKIIKSLDTLESEHSTDINIDTGDLKIIFDSKKTGISEIKTKITDAGFQVESVELE